MKGISKICLIMIFLLCEPGIISADTETRTYNNEPIHVFSIGMSCSYSFGIGANFFIPIFHLIEPSIFIRLFDFLDINILFYPFTAKIWMPGISFYIATTLLFRFEVLLSPEIGIYFPSVGIGYAFMGLHPEMFGGQKALHSPAVILAPFRFSIRKILKLPGYLMPFISFCEIRYGSLIPNNGLPGVMRPGNFLLNIDFIRIGCIIHSAV